jgi:hypothetical protein
VNDEKHLVIHFNNGQKMALAFPAQIRDQGAGLLEAFKRIMEADKLAIQTDDKLIMIPWAGVQHIEFSPPPATTPFGTIQKARVVE